jgi:L-2,4-diaminobutyrate decarboxylase
VLSTVLFRYLPADGADPDVFNSALRRELMRQGKAMLARVYLKRNGVRRVFLKLMLLNPSTDPAELDAVIDDVIAVGGRLDTA